MEAEIMPRYMKYKSKSYRKGSVRAKAPRYRKRYKSKKKYSKRTSKTHITGSRRL